MGTRHLIMVVSKGKTKVAQYGQWDGYPKGKGVKILTFLNTVRLDKFKEKVDKLKWLTKKEADEINKRIDDLDFPQELSRDTSTRVLGLIAFGDATKLVNSESFAADSLFCEWAYVIDLDKNVLEVHKGFNKGSVPKNSRFAKYNDFVEKGEKKEYYPVTLLKTYSFDNLPDEKTFIEECTPKEED